jgi:hypothetical protein
MEAGEVGETASQLVDPEHRLPGEVDSEGSPLLEDAQHWLQVYAELLMFKRTLLRTGDVQEEGAADAVVVEVVEVVGDRTLRGELGRLEQRHQFWERRAQELEELRARF